MGLFPLGVGRSEVQPRDRGEVIVRSFGLSNFSLVVGIAPSGSILLLVQDLTGGLGNLGGAGHACRWFILHCLAQQQSCMGKLTMVVIAVQGPP